MTVLQFSTRTWAIGLLALAGAIAAPLARADNVYWSIGAVTPGISVGLSNARPVYVQPGPVYVQPAPMYVYPRPDYYPGHVIYTPPRVVYPQPVYVQPAPAWGPPGHWKHPHRHGHGHGHGHHGR